MSQMLKIIDLRNAFGTPYFAKYKIEKMDLYQTFRCEPQYDASMASEIACVNQP